jgi:hypothetical protein
MACNTVVAVIALCLLTGGGSPANGASQPAVDFVAKLNELARKGRDESLNAAPSYQKAGELYQKEPPGVDFEEYRRWPSELTDDHRMLLEQWVKSNTDALVQIALGAQRPCYWPNAYRWTQRQGGTAGHWLDAAHKYATEHAFLGRALVVRAMLESMRGDPAKGIKDLLTCRRLALHLLKTPSLGEYLIGMVIVDCAARGTFLVLAKTDVNEDLLKSLEEGLSRERSGNPLEVFDFLEGQRIWMLEIAQSAFLDTRDDSKLKLEWQIELALEQNLTADEIEALDLRRGRTLEDVEAGYAYYRRFLAMRPWERKVAGLDFWEDHARVTRRNPLVRQFAFTGVGFARVRAHYEGNTDALITTVSLLRYKHDKGGLPVDLKELVSAGYLSALPKDPYSGGPLIYKRTGDDFVLYSIAEDSHDDRGKQDSTWNKEGGDYVFWPAQPK